MASSAEKLLERAKQSQSGWKRQELDRLYEGFGFIIRHGRNHDIISHPEHPDLREIVPRHRKVKPPYVRAAVKRISELLSRQEKGENE
jgi:hypothetical protein